MEMRGLMGGFYRISEWIMRLSAINLLWVICSIPFFFTLLSMLLIPDATTDQLLGMLWLLAALSPFTLVPATAAMFGVARKWVMGDTDVPLFKTYFRNYKENYKQSMLGGLAFLIIGAVLAVNIQFYLGRSDEIKWIYVLFVTFSIVVIAAFINFLSMTVHFHMNLRQLIKNSFIITLGQPINSFAILVTNGVIVFISIKFTFLIPFFMGSICAIGSFWYFYRGFQRIQDKAEKAKEKEEGNAEALEDGSTFTKE